MNRLQKLVLVVWVVLQSGCTLWPQLGQGGEADQYASAHYYEPAATLHETQAYLMSELESLRAQLDVLTLQGADNCIPASVKRLNLLSHRVRREISGQLFKDAAHDLVIFQREIRYIRQQFLTIAEQTHCREQNVDLLPMTQAIVSIYFDRDQAQVSEVFADQLRWWVDRISPSTKFIVKGYTDATGSAPLNEKLAESRIQSVKTLLFNFGVKPEDVTSHVLGDRTLSLQGQDDFSDGFNRRVDIFMSSTSQPEVPVTVMDWEALGLKARRHIFKSWD